MMLSFVSHWSLSELDDLGVDELASWTECALELWAKMHGVKDK